MAVHSAFAGGTDSLEQELKSYSRQDTPKVKTLLALCKANYGVDLDKMKGYSREAIALANSLDYPAGISEGYIYLSTAFILNNQIDSTEVAATQALEYANIAAKPALRARSFNILGIVYYYQADQEKALSTYLIAFSIMDSIGDSASMAKVSNNIGVIYAGKKEYEKALEYYHVTESITRAQKDTAQLANVLNNIAVILIGQRNYEGALDPLLESLELNKATGNLYGLKNNYNNLGQSYGQIGVFDKARFYTSKALEAGIELDSEHAIAEAHTNIARLYLETGQYDSTIYYAKKAVAFSKANKNYELEHTNYSLLADAAEKKGDLQDAVGYLRGYITLFDTLYGEKQLRNLNEMRVKYEAAQKEAENEKLRIQKALDNEIISQSSWITLLILVVLALAVALSVFLFRSNRKNKKVLQTMEQQKLDIEQVNLQLEKQKKALESAIHEKDSLVGIVAHDLKAPLTKVKSLAKMLGMMGGLSEKQTQIVGMLNTVTEDGENLIQDLLDITAAEQDRSIVKKENIELGPFLNDFVNPYISRANEKGIQIQLDLPGADRFLQSDPNTLRRILDNLLSNAIKFSPSETTTRLTAREIGEEWRIKVRDQGPGISKEDQKKMFLKFQKLTARPTAGESSTGLGLSIIKTLTEKLGGTISVTSELGKGTEFELRLPKN